MIDYGKLYDFAAPKQFTAPSQADIGYIVRFRQTCKHYNTGFSTTDSDEKEFAVRIAEKLALKHARPII